MTVRIGGVAACSECALNRSGSSHVVMLLDPKSFQGRAGHDGPTLVLMDAFLVA